MHPDLARTLARLLEGQSRIEATLSSLTQEIRMVDVATQASLDKLTAAVSADTDAENAAITALTGLAAQIAALKTGVTDPAVSAAIDAATALVTANTAKLSAAIVANTPAQ